jgi:anaerobic magnesium-protoporphyrin IX monomethyl ester cyclase
MKKFVLLVIPSMENAYHNLKDFVAIPIPIGITTIAAILETKGYEVKIIDADAENLSFEETLNRTVSERPDYVGSTTMTATMDITNRFYSRLKEYLPEVVVIVGGPHVSALPGETLEEIKPIDIIVKGEGDETIAELMDAIENNQDLSPVKGIAFRKNGGITETPDRELIEDLGKLPVPAYHLLKYDLYRSYGWNNWVNGYRKPLGVVFAGRGCYGKCNFCATKVMFGNKIRFFPPERIKKEIDLLVNKYRIRVLYFQDDTFTANRKIVNEICDYLIEKGYHKKLEIMVSSRTDTIYLPTLKKMRKAGIRWICFGVESGNQKILDIMRKKITLDQIRYAFRAANEAGLFVAGNYMLGHLGETYETAMDTINLACKLKQDYASFAIAIPLPGTELYQYCLDKKIKIPCWNDFGSVNTPPIPLNESLDAEQLLELRRIALSRFFKRPGYLLKMLWRFNTFSVAGDFLRMYFAFKKEVAEKRY